MQKNFENSIPEITEQLQHTNSYLDTERVVISNLKQQLQEGLPISAIDRNLEKLYDHINKLISQKSKDPEVVNFKYAAACLKTLISTPYWHSWIKGANNQTG